MYLPCRILVFLVCLAVLCGLPTGAAFGQKEKTAKGLIEMSDKEREWVAAHKDLRLGVWMGTPPFMFRDESGAMSGLIPTYMDLISRKLGLTPQGVRASSFSALWQLAKAREVDMVSAVSTSSERAQNMLLSEPYLFVPIVVATRDDHPSIAGLSDLRGKSVAVADQHMSYLKIIKDYPGIKLLPVKNTLQGLQALISGQADAFVGPEMSLTYLLRKHAIKGVKISTATEYAYQLSVGVRKDWPILLNLVNRALDSISEDEKKNIRDYWTVLRGGEWVERPHLWRVVGSISFGAALLLGMILFWNRKLAAEVDKRKQAEIKYRQAHKANERIIESASMIIVGLDYSGRVQLLNNAGEVATGYSREELIGQNWFETVVPKERFPYVWDEFMRLMRDEEAPAPVAFENPILTKAGETRHVLWRNSLSTEGDLAVISFGTDITARRRAEEELRLTQFAMDNAAVGVFRVRPSGRISYANRTAGNMLGYTGSQMKRLGVPDIVPTLNSENWPAMWQRLKKNRMLTLEAVLTSKDGVSFPVEISAYYLLFKGTELAIGFFSDISERKRVESLKEDVERMVRHDLRSPALAVQTLFKLFGRADNLTRDQHELLASVKASSHRMVQIIDMSRALYRMEAGTYRVVPEPVDIMPLIDSIATELGPLLRVQRVSLALTLHGKPVGAEHCFMVESEEMLCYALLSNLLRNAVEGSSEDDTVSIDFSHPPEGPTIKVHNTGVIPESIRDSFFDKYVTEGKDQGTGLGTYTSHLIVTTLGGEIGFTSSQQLGTTITVILPAQKNDTDS